MGQVDGCGKQGVYFLLTFEPWSVIGSQRDPSLATGIVDQRAKFWKPLDCKHSEFIAFYRIGYIISESNKTWKPTGGLLEFFLVPACHHYFCPGLYKVFGQTKTDAIAA